MNKELISAIREENWAEVRRIAFALPEEEKAFFKDKFTYQDVQEIYPETPKTHGYGANKAYAVSYAMMCICTNLKELAEIENRLDFGFYGRRYYQQKYLFLFLVSQHSQAFIDFLHTPQGAYMAEGAQKMYTEYPNYLSFEMLLALYKEGLIPFNEEIFVKRMYAMEYHRTQEELVVQLLSQNPELATRVIPHTPAYINYAISSNLEWQKVFAKLCKEGYFPDRNFITKFIEVLLNPWKKNVLDMYCRWIEGLSPTQEEIIKNQHTLFALLTLDKSSLINFTMKLIAQISMHPDFDFPAFTDNFALCFTVAKIAKSQLIGVTILEEHYKKQAPSNHEYQEQLAVLFTVPDVKLQEKVAGILTTYFKGEDLAETIVPYQAYLKEEVKDKLEKVINQTQGNTPLSSLKEETLLTETTIISQEYSPTPLSAPSSWDALLFLLGDCLREPVAHTIDVFLEGLIRLQDNFPSNLEKSFSPYIKQLSKRIDRDTPTDVILLGILHSLINNCPLTINPKCSYTWEERNQKYKELSEKEFEAYTLCYYLDNARQALPFLFHKGQIVIQYIQEHCQLPLLSTPTHLPFYIDTEIFIDKLLQYEAQGKTPNLDDLIVACNRLLFKKVSKATKTKARQFKGDYAPAIQYYLGMTNEIQLTEDLLPLWAQITRIKYPDQEFKEFATTSAKNILGVVQPYVIGYGWKDDESYKKFVLEHHSKWVGNRNIDLRNEFPYRYYNANGGGSPLTTVFEYKLSLNPHYPNAMLCGYTSTWVTGNEVREIRNMSLPLEALLRYDIRVRHSGWLYIGTALLFEKRPSRDLAYEYICQAIARGEDLTYLKIYLAQVLAWDYLPITRFIEFLDRPTHDAKLKAFGKEVIQLYLKEVEKQNKLPKNHKKLATFGN